MSGSDATVRAEAEDTKRRLAPPLLNWRRARLVPIAVGALAMALGLWAGLARLGLTLPPSGMPAVAEFHGAIMICGFLGTVISLERAVALGRWWSYAAPVLSSAGALLLLAGMPPIAAVAFLSAGAVFSIASASIAVRQPALFTAVLAIGAGCWGVGTLEWLIGYSMLAVVGWWLNFLILTIAAERLELGRVARPPPWSQVAFAIVVALLLVGSVRGELARDTTPFTAAGLLGCAAWLLRHDIARRTIRLVGQPRFAAVSILAGHLWLGIAGLLLLIAPPGATAFSYDAAVHAITIGFVLSMVFGHAPIILPAVIGLRVSYTPITYAPLALLHLSVILRLAGDVFERMDLRADSGIASTLALLGYVACLIFAARKSSTSKARRELTV